MILVNDTAQTCSDITARLNSHFPAHYQDAFGCIDEAFGLQGLVINSFGCRDAVRIVNAGLVNCTSGGRLDYLAGSCSALTTCTEGTEVEAAAPTPTTDRVCTGAARRRPSGTGGSSDSGSTSLSSGDKALAALSVVVAVAVVGYLFYHRRTLTEHTEQNETLHERLLAAEGHLQETQGDLEESQASNTRMRGAWQIQFRDVALGAAVAEGASGKVHTGSYAGHRVAVKVLKRPLDEELDPEGAMDFARECETLMSVRHTHLLIFFGAGTMPDNRPFMVTEYMALGSLKRVLADRGRVLDWAARTRIAAQVADGMAYLHSLKIVHRDFKSDNVLLNEQLDAKVADFGTSKLVTASRAQLQTGTTTGETSFGGGGGGGEPELSVAFQATMTKGVGTPLWMAPELFEGGTKYGPEVDVYSFGVVMWELATRKVPWQDEIATTVYIEFFAALSEALEHGVRPRVPAEVAQTAPEFVALLQQCWTTDPAARLESAAVAQLLAGLAGL